MIDIVSSNYNNIFFYLVLFAVYSFLGWIVEVIYRSITQREYVNAGFLYGPFIPIYGFGAVFIIILQNIFHSWHPALMLFIYGLALTVIEYIVGVLSEKIFKLTLWDYSDYKFNFQGRVCLLFSACWTALAFIFVMFIHPVFSERIELLDKSTASTAAVTFLIYFAVDFTFSVMSLSAFRRKIAYLYSEYFNLSNVEIEKIFASLQRLRRAFPDLNRYINNNINNEIRNRISSFLNSIRSKIIMELQGRKPLEYEYYEAIDDIYEHDEFLKLKEFFHHNSSIYVHVHDVAYLSYRICKYLNLDYRSAARGALLHDFFLYNWRNHDLPDLPRDKFHGIEHPAIALANAQKHFSLNEIEEDIIKKHMWPLTLVPPKYKESLIVSFADKYLSSKEFISEFRKKRNQRHEDRLSSLH
jgi:uncharacterized membrane protein